MRDRWWYRLDPEYRVEDVGPGWDHFAVRNDGWTALSDRVLGRPLWECISGDSTRHVLRLLFESVPLRGPSTEVTFRCDGPGVRRWMTWQAEREPAGGLLIRTRLVHEETRAVPVLLGWSGPREQPPIPVCSWCNRVQVEAGEWDDVENAVGRMGLFLERTLPEVTHGICGSCASLLERTAVGHAGG